MMNSAKNELAKVLRYSIQINGIVQGVGFRPFVYNIARELILSGFVKNTNNGVFIEAEGNQQARPDEHDESGGRRSDYP